jgi:hypothetical protein
MMLFALAVATAAKPFSLSHVSPARVSPLGGAVLLLHGSRSPNREALLGTATIVVGGQTCPLVAKRSAPRGDFLACRIPPIDRSQLSAAAAAVTVELHISPHLRTFRCSECRLTYDSTLSVDASLLLSHRRGAAGDVVTLVGVGAWSLLRD